MSPSTGVGYRVSHEKIMFFPLYLDLSKVLVLHCQLVMDEDPQLGMKANHVGGEGPNHKQKPFKRIIYAGGFCQVGFQGLLDRINVN